MKKSKFDGLMAGLREVLAHVEGDKSAVARTIEIPPPELKEPKKKSNAKK